MTKEEEQLLLKVLCSMLPYGVKVHDKYAYPHALFLKEGDYKLTAQDIFNCLCEDYYKTLENIKPYLRPLSSMTDDEIDAYTNTGSFLHANGIPFNLFYNNEGLNFLLSNHFDIFGLIEKGLALEAPDDMYKSNEE